MLDHRLRAGVAAGCRLALVKGRVDTSAPVLLKAGFHATGRGPDDFRRRIVEEVPKWKTVIEKGRITVQGK